MGQTSQSPFLGATGPPCQHFPAASSALGLKQQSAGRAADSTAPGPKYLQGTNRLCLSCSGKSAAPPTRNAAFLGRPCATNSQRRLTAGCLLAWTKYTDWLQCFVLWLQDCSRYIHAPVRVPSYLTYPISQHQCPLP